MKRRQLHVPPTIVLPPRWRRQGPGAVIVTLLLALVAFDRSRNSRVAGSDMDRYHDKTARVVHIADGDTFDVDLPDRDKSVTRIRLWGIDTPEVAHGGEPDMYFGKEAKAFTEQTLAGKNVRLVLSPAQSRDKFGRLLAYVYPEGESRAFNQTLVEEGYAYADWRFKHPYRDDFESAEQGARQNHRGLWADVTFDQMPPWRQRMEQQKKNKGHKPFGSKGDGNDD